MLGGKIETMCTTSSYKMLQRISAFLSVVILVCIVEDAIF